MTQLSVPHILRTFAELSREDGDFEFDVLRHDYDFVWLKSSNEELLRGETSNVVAYTTSRKGALLNDAPDEDKVDRLIGSGELHQTERLLRVGWLWISGTVTTGDGPTKYCFPLLSVPVVRSGSMGARVRQVPELFKSGVGSVYRVLEPVGDVELSSMVAGDGRAELLGEIQREHFAAFRSWRERAVAATGLDVERWHPPETGSPGERSQQDGVVAFVGIGLYLHQAPSVRTRRQELLQLALTHDLDESCLQNIYSSTTLRKDDTPSPTARVRPLTSRQATVAANSGAGELAVISGAPGTGKTHVLSSIAIDCVTRQRSVLVVGSTRYATDVLLEHFVTIGSIQPVVFGSSRHRKRFAELLVERERDAAYALDQIDHDLADVEQRLAIEREALLQRSDPTYRAARLAELERAGDPDELANIVKRYFLPRPTDLFRNNGRKIEQRLDIELSELEKSLGNSEQLRAYLDGRVQDCLAIGAASQRSFLEPDAIARNLDDLVELTDLAIRLGAERIQIARLGSLSRSERHTRSRLKSIMLDDNRADRARRLQELDSNDIAAAQLWVGALEDVNDLLPRTAGLFDLVVIDEAAQTSQPEAAGVLMRGKRAILCGDPQQLRHQSNLSSDQVRAATDMFGTDPDVLDVAAHSILDVVASKVPAQLLDEHFRSAPHLIEFSNRRFYGGELKTTTRHPSNEAADHIRVVTVPSGRRTLANETEDEANGGDGGGGGTNAEEAAQCLMVSEQLIAEGWRSIGFVSPFDAQAKLLEDLILRAYSVGEIDEYGLRVGTVRAFQGDERDVMILSWAVGADEDDDAWEPVNQDALFNVMVTRARREVVVVTSNPSPPGLAGQYVSWAEPLTGLDLDQPSSDPWIVSVVDQLTKAGIATRTGYRVGAHIVDLVAGTGTCSVAIDCRMHPDGPDAHVERALMLRRAQWRTSEAYEQSWDYRLDDLPKVLMSQFPDLGA